MIKNKEYLNRITLGTASLGGSWYPIDQEKSVDTLLYAMEQGITNLDTAPAYMDAELVVGKAIRQWQGKDLFISTKIGKRRGWADQQGLSDFTLDSIKSSLNTSLERLGRNHIDLLFLHEPEKINANYFPSILELLFRFKEQGAIKHIGLGGRPPRFLEPYIKEGHFNVIMDFNGYNLVERKALKNDFAYYRQNNLEIYEASPLMMGLLGSRLVEYEKNRPSWLSEKNLERTLELERLSAQYKMPLATLAHRFLYFNTNIDRMVIGPDNLTQLKATINDLEMGPLNEQLISEINVTV